MGVDVITILPPVDAEIWSGSSFSFAAAAVGDITDAAIAVALITAVSGSSFCSAAAAVGAEMADSAARAYTSAIVH